MRSSGKKIERGSTDTWARCGRTRRPVFSLWAAGLFALGALGARGAAAANFTNGARGATGAAFLELPVDARAVAMGSAQGAAVRGASALYYNPGALASLDGGTATFMQGVIFQGLSLQYLALAQRVAGVGVVAGSVQYLSAGSLLEVDNTGLPTGGSIAPRDLAATLGYASSWRGLEFGAGLQYIASKIRSTARTFAVDLGVRRRFGPWALGAAASHLGRGLRFRSRRDPLPAAFRLGSSYEAPAWTLALDLVAPKGARPFVGAGVERRARASQELDVAARLGYNSRTASSGLGGLAGFSAGAGLELGGLEFDYAVAPFGDLNVTHRFSAAWSWGR